LKLSQLVDLNLSQTADEQSMRKMDISTPTVSTDLVAILVKYAVQTGLDGAKILESAGIDSGELMESGRIPARRFDIVWTEVEQQTQDPDFGLHFGLAMGQYAMGHVLYTVILNSPTVGEALARLCRYHGLMADAVQPRLHYAPPRAGIQLETSPPNLQLSRHNAEFIFSLFASILRFLTDNRHCFSEVRFQHSAPADTFEHQQIFKTDVVFEQAQNELTIDSSLLLEPVILANPSVLEALEPVARRLMDRLYSDKLWTDHVSQTQSRMLLKGQKPSIEAVAGELAVSIRQLQNRLSEEGTTYQCLFDRVRREIALNFLDDQDMSMADIAFLVGFSDQSGFNHAFKKWTGMTPGAYRNRKGK
jgi:AraC-like DNA-binding protein